MDAQWWGCFCSLFPPAIRPRGLQWQDGCNQEQCRIIQCCVCSPSGCFFRSLGQCSAIRSVCLINSFRAGYLTGLLSSKIWAKVFSTGLFVDLPRRSCTPFVICVCFSEKFNHANHQILTTIAGSGSKGLAEIYAGRGTQSAVS